MSGDNITGTTEEAAAREAASAISDAWDAICNFFGGGHWPWDKRLYVPGGTRGLFAETQIACSLVEFHVPWAKLKSLTGFSEKHFRQVHNEIVPSYLNKPDSQCDDIDAKRKFIARHALDAYRAAVRATVLAVHGSYPAQAGPEPKDGVPFNVRNFYHQMGWIPHEMITAACTTGTQREACEAFYQWTLRDRAYWQIIIPAASTVTPWVPSKQDIESGDVAQRDTPSGSTAKRSQMLDAARAWTGPPSAIWAMRRAFVLAVSLGAGVLIRYMQCNPLLFRAVARGFPVDRIPNWSLLSHFGTRSLADLAGESLSDFFESLESAGSDVADWVENELGKWAEMGEAAEEFVEGLQSAGAVWFS